MPTLNPSVRPQPQVRVENAQRIRLREMVATADAYAGQTLRLSRLRALIEPRPPEPILTRLAKGAYHSAQATAGSALVGGGSATFYLLATGATVSVPTIGFGALAAASLRLGTTFLKARMNIFSSIPAGVVASQVFGQLVAAQVPVYHAASLALAAGGTAAYLTSDGLNTCQLWIGACLGDAADTWEGLSAEERRRVAVVLGIIAGLPAAGAIKRWARDDGLSRGNAASA